ncbi:MAG: sensor domain-containing diguanylate cyclase [Arcobacteraceae bacterium]
MKSKYRILIQISLFLMIIASAISMTNYYISLENSKTQLKNISLPLSLDNIYTEIQKNIVQPYLVSSMMANDTFVHDWLKNSEEDKDKITEYLSAIKNKYNMFSTFLVSNISDNYYTQDGFIEKVDPKNTHNQWYFKFIQDQNMHEINIDANENLSNTLMMFINYKILDKQYKLIGATGVALKTKYINDMLRSFRQRYGFKVTFFNKNGDVVLSEKGYNNYKSIQSTPILKPFKEQIITKESNTIEIEKDQENFIIHTKYIEELHLYLTVEAKVSDYASDLRKVLYFNLFASLGIVLFIVIVLYRIIHRHNIKLEEMAFFDPLTNIYNRRIFLKKLQESLLFADKQKQKFCVVFIDIDDFKNINDTKGHHIGDEVLKLISKEIKSSLRNIDIIARWGGEEFVILLPNIKIEDGQKLTERIRLVIEHSIQIQELLSSNITVSIGITEFKEHDTIDTIVKRADEAMYTSKKMGKNQVTVV